MLHLLHYIAYSHPILYNLFSSTVNTTYTFLAMSVPTTVDVNRLIHFALETKGEKEKESDDLLEKNLACSYVSWEKGRKREYNREKERERQEGWKKPFRPSRSEQEKEWRELWGCFIVKMKAPPLVAAPLLRGRRNRPIDSCIYHRGSMIQPGLPTTTLATDDSWCSWPENLLCIRRFSFRRLIASRYRCGAMRQAASEDFADRYIRLVFRSLVASSTLMNPDFAHSSSVLFDIVQYY